MSNAAAVESKALNGVRSGRRFIGEVAFDVRLQVVRELLAALELATDAGQLHLMDRVADILRRTLTEGAVELTPVQQASATTMMAELERERARAAPRFAVFRRAASGVIELLSYAIRPGLAES